MVVHLDGVFLNFVNNDFDCQVQINYLEKVGNLKLYIQKKRLNFLDKRLK